MICLRNLDHTDIGMEPEFSGDYSGFLRVYKSRIMDIQVKNDMKTEVMWELYGAEAIHSAPIHSCLLKHLGPKRA